MRRQTSGSIQIEWTREKDPGLGQEAAVQAGAQHEGFGVEPGGALND
jgi:hypothetical protein